MSEGSRLAACAQWISDAEESEVDIPWGLLFETGGEVPTINIVLKFSKDTKLKEGDIAVSGVSEHGT